MYLFILRIVLELELALNTETLRCLCRVPGCSPRSLHSVWMELSLFESQISSGDCSVHIFPLQPCGLSPFKGMAYIQTAQISGNFPLHKFPVPESLPLFPGHAQVKLELGPENWIKLTKLPRWVLAHLLAVVPLNIRTEDWRKWESCEKVLLPHLIPQGFQGRRAPGEKGSLPCESSENSWACSRHSLAVIFAFQ